MVPFSPRPGKVVTNSAAVSVDTNFDGVPDTTTALTTVTNVNRNLITGVLAQLPNGSNTGPGTWANFAGTGGQFGGGNAAWTLTTNFGPGNNNEFNLIPVTGGFNRSTTTTLDIGARAPVVTASSATNGDSAVPQSLTLTGNEFNFGIPRGPAVPPLPTTFAVTSVFAQQVVNNALTGPTLPMATFNVLNNNVINATLDLSHAGPGGGVALVGTKWALFAANANGTSRNAPSSNVPGGTDGSAGADW
jgi:hypothetical protein